MYTMNTEQPSDVYLRPLEETDLEWRVKWINDRSISKSLMFDYPTSLAKTKNWFNSNLMNETKRHFTIINKKKDHPNIIRKVTFA